MTNRPLLLLIQIGTLLAMLAGCTTPPPTQPPLTTSMLESLRFEGVGMSVQATPSGYRVAALLPGGSAMTSGQVENGDIILGLVRYPGNPYVDAQHVSLAELVGLIRGEPDTWLVLRLQRGDHVADVELQRRKTRLDTRN
jgi:C-terminal processing protease CtpA/Prc